jgi:hypothetical protein
MGSTQADCEVQLNDAATEQRKTNKGRTVAEDAAWGDTFLKRDQVTAAVKVTTPTTAGCCGRAVT